MKKTRKRNKENLTPLSRKGEVRGMMVCDSIKDIIPHYIAFVNSKNKNKET
jgi:hypothetical protein